MARQLVFTITPTNSHSHYLLHFCSRSQMAADCSAESLFLPDGIEIFYDEWNDEFTPVNGFDHTTARGDLVMQAINSVYSEALDRIRAQSRRMIA